MTSCKASTFFSQEVFRNCWLQTQEVFSAQKLKLDVSFLGLVFISWVTSKLRNSEEALRLSLLEIAFKVCSVQGESLPLTESLTALWQKYCQDHTHPQAKLVGKIRGKSLRIQGVFRQHTLRKRSANPCRYVFSSYHWPLRWPSTNDKRDGPLLDA